MADFTYRSGHVEFLRRRREFFEVPAQPILCLWWIPEGTVPSVTEAITRLEQLRAHGPTQVAFTFRQRFDPDGSVEGDLAGERDVCPA